ncbi:PAS domain-containing protein [Halanaerobiaceae bacterium Z-7014]|uniref:histidine kinase n=1 Tax=Halonatronomonas betaini TaxID=2778430 RepID=A0A931AP55_9FIRM|nr:ATP-binding protein [Halonatronomonas betaini]MBF8435917.1 PAS domain-containing protein [Halonatronomonas betaini]
MKLIKKIKNNIINFPDNFTFGVNTLFMRLFIRFLLLSLIVIMILGLATIYFFDDFYFSKTETDIVNNSQVLNQALYNSIIEDDEDMVQNSLQLVAEINSGQAWLINEEGLMIDSHPYLETQDSNIRFLNAEQIFEGNIISQRVEPRHFERPMLLIGMPVRQMDNVVAGLLVFTSVEGINSTVRQVRQLMVYSSLIAILLGIFLAYSWSKSLASPLQNMSQVVTELEKGDYGRQIELNDDDASKEINNLKNSFNSLSLNLKESITDLTRERNKLKYILTGMEEGVLAVDKSEDVIVINDALNRIFYVSKNSVGKNYKKLNIPQQVKDSIEIALKNKKSIKEEFTLAKDMNKNKSSRRIILRCNPIIMREEVWGIVILFQDISDRWRFEKLQQDFVANVSHELKAPLSSIKGSAEILLDGIIKDKEKQEEYLEIVLNESDRLTELVDEILRLAEYQNQDFIKEKETVSIQKLIEEVTKTFNKSGPLADRIEVINNAELVSVKASKASLKQVLFNFLDNARKFSPEYSKIKLIIDSDDQYVIVKVVDQGVGIPQDEIDNIWERFYKLDKVRTPGSSGSGLGLSICREIIKNHDGDVFVESKYGEGSTFGFKIPKDNS